MPDLGIIAILFLLIATVYSSVGFGGGSSYIAILLIFSAAIPDVRFIALVCNIIVVLGSTINYYRQDMIPWRKILPLVILSIPAAYLGGRIQPDENAYFVITGATLVAAAFVMLIKKKSSTHGQEWSILTLALIGLCLGFLAGFIGIGGGIFLAPLLYLIAWGKAKEISAAASVFILFNSIAGISGQLHHFSNPDWKYILILGFCVLVGGQIGNRLNLYRLNPLTIKVMTALLVGFVGFRLLLFS